MERKPDNIKITDSEENNGNNKKFGCIMCLPYTALLLNLITYILFLIWPSPFIIFLFGIFPIIGFLIGIIALCCGKKRIGKLGMIISLVAIAWPFIFIATIQLFGRAGALLPIM